MKLGLRSLLALAPAILGALVACSGGPQTQVVFRVTNEGFSVPAELDAAELLVQTATNPKLFDQTYTIAGAVKFPIELVLAADVNQMVEFRAVARGIHGGVTIVEQSAKTMFIPGKTLVLTLQLLPACKNVHCLSGETCTGGGNCSDEHTKPSDLPEKGKPGKDAAATDAAEPDAPVDGGDGDVTPPFPGTCKACTKDDDCGVSYFCVTTADSAQVCLPGCDVEKPSCPMGFTCQKASPLGWAACVPDAAKGGGCCVDEDGDGYGQGGSCKHPGGDCNDRNAAIHPGATEMCDGLDNDCNPATVDGMAEANFGAKCDGPDKDLCQEGTMVCTAGSMVCSDTTGDSADICNGMDDDCDPSTADGSGDPLVGMDCDGPDKDLCKEGTNSCESGAILCSDVSSDDLDICDGMDNDCNPATPDGADDPLVGVACDGPDSDLCQEGMTVCGAGVVACSDTTGDNVEICNGMDDDCNPATPDGDADPMLGMPCDGPDKDKCTEGVFTACTAGALACSDNTGDTPDLCNGDTNDDCDSTTPDGADDPRVNLDCDGPDTDLCKEGKTVCDAGGAVTCNDTTGDNVEVCDGMDNDCNPATADGSQDTMVGVDCSAGRPGCWHNICSSGAVTCNGGVLPDICNGIDDDCNPATADGSADPGIGMTCDGPDKDLCKEGTFDTCVAGVLHCTDATGDTLDVCNGADDDCDPGTADGSGDVRVGTACDGADPDMCKGGVSLCVSGAISCNESTGGTNPDVCDGLDNDCDPATADGSADPRIGQPCDGPDKDLCKEGTYTGCAGGMLTCSDTGTDNPDVCDGVDNDCDPTTPDGVDDPMKGAACDGPDSDKCKEGTFSCMGGMLACSDATAGTPDICNGVDDDCDPSTADGSGEATFGMPCDGTDSDRCNEGNIVCDGVSLKCSDMTGDTVEICNGLDDDCDGTTDNNLTDATLGMACDGPDTDLCKEGVFVCSGAAGVTCNDATGNNVELCNGMDDDCNPSTADDAGDAMIGMMCDGPDADLCKEGTLSCVSGGYSCSDSSGDNLDVCNGMDDDCNPATPDGSADPNITGMVACDGPDTDLCKEGIFDSCVGGVLHCNDATPSTVDVCNGADDDCNPGTVDGAADPMLGALCDGGDTDLCKEGTFSCSGGMLVCSDATGNNVESCNGADDDCNGTVDDGGALLCPPTAHVTTTDCGGAAGCQITGCAPNWYNNNGVSAGYADGCECGETQVGSSCAGAVGLGAIASGNAGGVSGAASALPVAGLDDWWVVTFTPVGAAGGGTPTVNFARNDGGAFRFEVRPNSCASAVCTGVGGATGLTSWSFVDNQSAGYYTRAQAWPTTMYIRVYRVTPVTSTCEYYQIHVARP